MKKFNPETEITFECKCCEKKEIVKLKDLPSTPKGFFILPTTVQCSTCLMMVAAEIKD